jgi:hypothetical protein
MYFDCDRCAYSTTKRSDFIRHLSRKEPCIATVSNVSIIDIKKKYQLIEPTRVNDPATHPYECLYCNRRYKYKYNKTKHLKTCALRRESESIRDHLEKEDNKDGPALSEVLHAINMLHQKVDLILSRKMPYTINLFNGQSESESESTNSSDTHTESVAVHV